MSTKGLFNIDEFCGSQEPADLSLLHSTTQAFVQRLSSDLVSTIHPFCGENAPRPYEIPGVPVQGPLINHDHLESVWDVLVTVMAMAVPELAAMAELWLRLFACLIAPLGMAHLLREELSWLEPPKHKKVTSKTRPRLLSLVCLLTVASSVVLLTDTLYILEFGPVYGASLLLLSLVLALRACARHGLSRITRISAIGLLLLAIFLSVDFQDSSVALSFGGKRQDRVGIAEGLYYDVSNPRIADIVENHWPESFRMYNSARGATPWMPSGDSRTGLPFLLNKVPSPNWTRLWLSMTADDGEVVALDMAFPETGHDVSQPVYMVLHGLNGGSAEEYVQDFTWRRTAEGSTVVVMVARGLMDLPVRGWNVFHGARWTDVDAAAKTLRKGLVQGQILGGVGFSMGYVWSVSFRLVDNAGWLAPYGVFSPNA